jgi:predicted DNA-binding transcriptional regulator AlpA
MKILNPSEVVKKTGLSRVTLWRLEKIGQFPARVNLTEARVGWPENEIDEWIESRPRGICNREIRKETADVRG